MHGDADAAASAPIVIKASEFKAKCLQIMNRVAETGDEVVITKNGIPISRLVPYRTRPQSLFGIDRGRMEILGDIITPLDAGWEVHEAGTEDTAR